MKKLIAVSLLASSTAAAGTLQPTGEDFLWTVDNDPNTLLLLQPTEVVSDLVGVGVIYQVTGAFGNTTQQVVYPVYGSCVVTPAGWNTGEFAQCSIRGAGLDATILLDVTGNGTYTGE